MSEESNIFETSEFFLSCFLKARKLEFVELKKIQGSKYKFVFKKGDIKEFKKLMSEWYQADDERVLLQACTDLKYELRKVKNVEVKND